MLHPWRQQQQRLSEQGQQCLSGAITTEVWPLNSAGAVAARSLPPLHRLPLSGLVAGDVVFRLGDRALLIQFKAAHAQVRALPPPACTRRSSADNSTLQTGNVAHAASPIAVCVCIRPRRKVRRFPCVAASAHAPLRCRWPPPQVLDAKRKFIEAALRYLDVMRSVEAAEVDEAELIAFVEKAAICAVLAPAGPQRQRVMGTLMRLDKISLVQVGAHDLFGLPVAA